MVSERTLEFRPLRHGYLWKEDGDEQLAYFSL
jgi:succinylglutamate desuccinylase